MEWNMLNESKKLFPHWLDKSDNSNFTKHLKILNNQQRDIRHNIKCVDWSRLLNKPLQIHKVQSEPYKWSVEFEANVPRLKEVNIYKNPTIVDNNVVNNYKVVNGYFHEGSFYKKYSSEITNISDDISEESNISVSGSYSYLIHGKEDNYYHDLMTGKFYTYSNNNYAEVSESDVPQTSLIYSESFIDNYSHFFRHTIYEDNSNDVIINKCIIDSEGNPKLYLPKSTDVSLLYYNITTGEYGFIEDDDFKPTDNIIWVEQRISETDTDIEGNEINIYEYYYMDDNNEIIVDKESVSKIGLIESENITPIISNDKYVLEVYTWDDYHFLKGYPEIDFIDYNNNNIIDVNERTYDDLQIKIEKINNKEYLTFRIHQYGIKLVEIFKDEKPIHIADFIIENYNIDTKTIDSQINNNFAHIPYVYNYNDNKVYYPFEKNNSNIEQVNLEVDEYVWRYEITEDDKLYDENHEKYELKNKYDLKVTYYDALHPYDSTYDKTISKTYVCEDNIFYHDISLDMLGVLYNVPRHVFTQPYLETYDEQLEFYSKTYPKYSNTLNEDDYHYQKRLEYYINNYNKIYFPELELWKYYHIQSTLVNRKVLIAEQNYSYLRTLNAGEKQYINELSKSKLESYYTSYKKSIEEVDLTKPVTKSIISHDDSVNSRNGILVDDDGEYIKDIYGNYVRINYVYNINNEGKYVIKYKDSGLKLEWYYSDTNQFNEHDLKLTDLLKVVPNTRYRLRFCVKKYPLNGLDLRIIYKNNDNDVREIETIPLQVQDCDDYEEYNELIYNHYDTEWNIDCEYIYLDFLTLPNAQNIELCLESKDQFQISDITLQRITINHYDTEYMRTRTDYNSCVYDLYADYTEIPSNIRYDDLTIFNKILNRSLPLTKVGYFNFIMNNNNMDNTMKLETETNLYIDNMLDVDTSAVPVNDYANNITTHTYQFNKFVKKGDYELIFKPTINNNIIFDLSIDIKMLIYNENTNTSSYELLTLTDLNKYYDNDEDCLKIPFENKSDSYMEIKLYHEETFNFKDFKLIRKAPLTMEEITA